MEVKKIYNEENQSYDYEFIQKGNRLVISILNNLDIYFTFYPNESNTLEIDKENMYIYNLFDELYNNIKDCNIFNVSNLEKSFNKETDLKKIEKIKTRSNEILKYKQKDFFIDNKIVWVSDDSKHDKYNGVTIEKEDDKYILDFTLDDKENCFNTIRISNSGCRYTPFNKCFMNMYKELKQYEPEQYNQKVKKLEIK